MFFILIISLLILIILFLIIISNKIKTLRIKIEEAQSDLEVYLIQRYDILTESCKVAKKYMEHETDLMLNITKVRKGMNIDETIEIIKSQEDDFNKLFATAEAYPQLYSSELFKTLQTQITETNEHLSASKRLYNSNVSVFNQYIVQFPINLVANMINEKQKEFLKDSEIETKKNINLTF